MILPFSGLYEFIAILLIFNAYKLLDLVEFCGVLSNTVVSANWNVYGVYWPSVSNIWFFFFKPLSLSTVWMSRPRLSCSLLYTD